MPKLKVELQASSSASSIRAENLILRAKKRLIRAVKLAKGFERQKLARRIKQAEEDGDGEALARLQLEVVALKDLAVQLATEQYLYKLLLKNKLVATSSQMPTCVRVQPVTTVDRAGANIVARLFNANAVREELDKSLPNILVSLGLKSMRKPKKKLRPIAVRESTNLSRPTTNEQSVSRESADGDSGNIEESESLEQHESPVLTDHDATIPNNSATTRSNAIYLPSLTEGGYWSGSESGSAAEDIDEPKLKNRPGQRERRRQWELKYGNRANHIRDEAKNDRNAGWDAKRGAWSGGDHRHRINVGGNDAHRSSFVRPETGGGHARQGAGAADRRRAAEAAAAKPLHPSWEAARKAKERNETLPFQGKKLVFD